MSKGYINPEANSVPNSISPNPILDIYDGEQEVIKVKVFEDRQEELEWVARSVYNDVKKEGVAPDQIVIICLDSGKMKDYLPVLQRKLLEKRIPSTIPGLIDDTAAFGEFGKITLSTVFRAKGNEAYVVYVCGFESLYDYVEAVDNRNRVFTAVSRSKAWVRLSGVGEKMKQANKEVSKILADLPRFKFIFPNMEVIRRLDAETEKRRRAVKKVKSSVSGLLDADPKALEALAESDPEIFGKLARRISEVKRNENQ